MLSSVIAHSLYSYQSFHLSGARVSPHLSRRSIYFQSAQNGRNAAIACRAVGHSELSSSRAAPRIGTPLIHPSFSRSSSPNSSRASFMTRNCPDSCHKKTFREPSHRVITDDGQEEFYELSARDAKGRVLSMDNFEGYVTVLVNAARVCGESVSSTRCQALDTPGTPSTPTHSPFYFCTNR